MSDNISHHDINEDTTFKVNQKKHEAAKRKCKPKTEVQRLKKVFYIFTGIWMACQVVSATLCATGFYYFASININGNPLLVGSFVLGASIALEVIFNELNKERANQKYDDETAVSSVISNSILICLVFYGGSTFFGTTYAIEYLAAPPIYNDIKLIAESHDELIKTDTLKWNQKRFMASSAADAFLISHGKRDCKGCPIRIRTGDLKRHNELLGRIDSVNFPADVSLSILLADKKQDIKVAKEENKVMKADHLVWCGSFGWAMSFVSVLCIGIFLVTYDWTQAYKRKEIIDNDAILSGLQQVKDKEEAQVKALIAKDEANSQKDKGKDEAIDTPKVIENEAPTSIGFATAVTKEGDILKGKGRKSDRVYVMVKEELRAMTFGELNTLQRGQSTTERINHLESLKQKLK